MLSCSVSTLVAKLLRAESIYTIHLLRRGIDMHRREENLMQAFTVSQVMHREAPTLPETAPFAVIVQHFLTTSCPTCFVVDEHRRLLGTISIHDVKDMFQEETLGTLIIAKDLAYHCPATTTPEEALARCLEKFTQTEQEHLPVVTSSEELCGMISQRDVLDLYHREILRHEYLGLSLRSEQRQRSVHKHVRLPHSYVVTVTPVPSRYSGKTLREIGLRSTFHLTAVAIQHGNTGEPDEFPDPDQPLTLQDQLVLVGRPADLQRFVAELDEPQPLPHSQAAEPFVGSGGLSK